MSTIAAKTNHLFMNPLIKKLSKINETSTDKNAASYTGIAGKCTYFVITLLAGLIAYFFLHQIFDQGASLTVEGVNVNEKELIVLGICMFLTIVTPLTAFLIRPLIPIAGTLYCFGTGYLVSWMANTFAAEYASPVWIALGLTLLIVLVLTYLYTSGLVTVGKKFRTVVFTLVMTSLAAGIIAFIGSFIPGLKTVIAFAQNNYLISIIGSLFFIILASLFLLVDFDTLKNTVENKLPKKYEWMAAFGLIFTIIWLYLKILNLIIQSTRRK